MPSIFGLVIVAIGLILLHYGLTGAAFPLLPVATAQPISKLGSVTSSQ